MCATEGWVIYSCFGGTHTSPVAAGLHLGLLPRGRPFTLDALQGLPPFDRLDLKDAGTLRLWGLDRFGFRVATVGHRGRPDLVRAAVVSALAAGGRLPRERIHWVDCHDLLTPGLRLGGYLSRRLGLVRPGRFLLLRGLEAVRQRLEARVDGVLARLASGGAPEGGGEPSGRGGG